MYWKDQNGKVWGVWEMETSHIENCIKMVERKLEERPEEQVYIGDGDTAGSWVEQENEHNREIADKLEEILYCFNKELRERKNGKPIGTPPKEMTAVIHTCSNCGKLDAEYHDGHSCEEYEITRREREMTEYNN